MEQKSLLFQGKARPVRLLCSARAGGVHGAALTSVTVSLPTLTCVRLFQSELSCMFAR